MRGYGGTLEGSSWIASKLALDGSEFEASARWAIRSVKEDLRKSMVQRNMSKTQYPCLEQARNLASGDEGCLLRPWNSIA